MKIIDIDIQKTFKKRNQVKTLSYQLQLPLGKTTLIQGESGSGKTTLLRIIAGLERADSGKIVVAKNVWFDSKNKINVKPKSRKVALVFQDYNLFPNLTIKENICFASNSNELASEISDIVQKLDLEHLLSHKPSDLSGGQQQRFSLIRAIAQQPEFLLLDEPFSGLDDSNIAKILPILKELDCTIIVASHRNYFEELVEDKIELSFHNK